jgi:hypothetical protein
MIKNYLSQSNTSMWITALTLFLFNVAQAQYCVPDYSDCTDSDEIINVTFAGINNNSNCNEDSGYSDFTSLTPANVLPTHSYTLSVSVPEHFGYSSTGAWIDFDNSGTFDEDEFYSLGFLLFDAGELTATISVPASATSGTVRMRIKHLYAGLFDIEEEVTADSACLPIESEFGEVEDYSVIIATVEACAGAPVVSAPTTTRTEVCPTESFTLSLTSTFYSGTTHQWQASTNSGSTWNNIGTAGIEPSYTVAAQSATTQYRVIVTCTAAALSTTSSIITVTTTTNIESCYCTYNTDIICDDGDLITNVTFVTINHNSDCPDETGYSNYTQTVAPAVVVRGQSYPISVTVGPSGEGWEFESVGVWIDFNHNGSFEESEFTYVGTGLDETLTGNILIPADSYVGNTRMRVGNMAVEGNNFDHTYGCTPSDYGEVEDYVITIENEMSVIENQLSRIALFPNPTSGSITLQSNTMDINSIQVTTITGQTVLSHTFNQPSQIHSLNVQQLVAGSYFISIATETGTVTKKLIKQ